MAKLFVVRTRDDCGRQRYALCRMRSPGVSPGLENSGAIAMCRSKAVADKLADLWNAAEAGKVAK